MLCQAWCPWVLMLCSALPSSFLRSLVIGSLFIPNFIDKKLEAMRCSCSYKTIVRIRALSLLPKAMLASSKNWKKRRARLGERRCRTKAWWCCGCSQSWVRVWEVGAEEDPCDFLQLDGAEGDGRLIAPLAFFCSIGCCARGKWVEGDT